MDYGKDLMDYINKISDKEIQRLRQSYNENQKIDNYLYKTSEKIFKKLVFPYIRFEILQTCINDIKENSQKYYPQMKPKEIKRVGIILQKLGKICLCLNYALDEYYKMMSYVDKLNCRIEKG